MSILRPNGNAQCVYMSHLCSTWRCNFSMLRMRRLDDARFMLACIDMVDAWTSHSSQGATCSPLSTATPVSTWVVSVIVHVTEINEELPYIYIYMYIYIYIRIHIYKWLFVAWVRLLFGKRWTLSPPPPPSLASVHTPYSNIIIYDHI